MKFSWKNIENWRSWKMSFFWVGHFEFFFSKKKNCFIFFQWKNLGFHMRYHFFFCTLDGFFRILEKRLSELICTRLYIVYVLMKELLNFWSFRHNSYRFQTSVLAWRDSYSVGLVIQRLVAGNSAPVLVQKLFICHSFHYWLGELLWW